MSFCHKLWYSNPNIFSTRWRRPLIFQTTKAVILNNLSLKYQIWTPSDCKDIEIRKFAFVPKTQFLYISACQIYVNISRKSSWKWAFQALPGQMKTWCRAPSPGPRFIRAHLYQACITRVCSKSLNSFKGTLPDNLDGSSKLLYSKELGWFSQPQMGFSFFSIFCLTLRIFGSL